MDFQKQLNRISKAVSEIPYEKVYIEITTKTEKFILEKHKETSPIGFRGGAVNG